MSPTLRELIGETAYLILVKEFAGQKIYIPKEGCCHEEIERRNKHINTKYRILIEQGIVSSCAIQQIAIEFNISDTTVRHILD